MRHNNKKPIMEFIMNLSLVIFVLIRFTRIYYNLLRLSVYGKIESNHFIWSEIAYRSQIELCLFNFTDFLRCWLPNVSFWLSLSLSLSFILWDFSPFFLDQLQQMFLIYFALLPTPKGHCTNNIKLLTISHIHRNYNLV